MSTLQLIAEQAKENFQCNAPKVGGDSVHTLFDFRVVAYITGRQTGQTQAVLDIFNPETDVYISTDRMLIENFGERLGKPFRYLNLNSKSIREVFRHVVTGHVERVFIDVSATGLFRRRNVIDFTIKAFDEHLGNDINPIFIIT